MSETLTSQDIKDLKEMPDTLEMGELRKISTLQDIPLAEGSSLQSMSAAGKESHEENDRKLKTNSLKRFFRLSPKNKSDDGSLEAGKSEIEFDEGFEIIADQKVVTGSFSKASLKSSLNSYLSSVFKHKKSGKSLKSKHELHANPNEIASSGNSEICSPAANDLVENVSYIEDKNIAEEIQSLNISEECTQK